MQQSSTRRTFLRAASAAPAMWAASRTVAGANDRIQVGMIGVGSRGAHLLDLVLRRVRDSNDAEVVALCDVYQARLNKAAAKAPGARTYMHHQELLDQKRLDAVVIATPDHWHAPITLAALDRGIDVYCEKPMTHTLEEARIVRDRVREKKRVMQVGVQAMSWNRWHKIRDVVQAGTLGKVVAVQGTYSRNNPDGDWNWTIDPGAGPDAKGDCTSIGNSGSAQLGSDPLMPTGSSGFASTGIIPAGSRRIFITTSSLHSSSRSRMSIRCASPAWVACGSTTMAVRSQIPS